MRYSEGIKPTGTASRYTPTRCAETRCVSHVCSARGRLSDLVRSAIQSSVNEMIDPASLRREVASIGNAAGIKHKTDTLISSAARPVSDMFP